MRERRIVLLILLLSLVAGIANVDAASRKKKKSKKHKRTEQITATVDTPAVHYTRKEERKMHRQERKRRKHERKLRKHGYETESEYTYNQPEKKPVAFKYPTTVMKTRYRVDVLASMYLDELVKKGEVTFKDKIPDKAVPGISFYEGLTIAADSLKKAGFNLDIYVHDIASASESADSLVSKGILDSSDLIIGAVPPFDIPIIAEYARKKKINFISALSFSDGGVKQNKYLTLVQPTLKSHCEWIADDIAKKFPGMRVALLYRTSSEADEHAYKYLTGGGDKMTFREFNCNTMPTKESLVSVFDSLRPNVVVVPIFDVAAADSVLRTLSRNFPGTHFEVYGMPSWTTIAGLKKESVFPNLSVNVTTPFNIDGTTPVGKYVARTYKHDYGGKATEYVYRGFETMFWYANLLKQYGTMFNSNYTDNSTAPFTKFEIKQRRDNEGHILFNENTHIYISKYEGGFLRTE